jgi:hypothetical protein
LFDHLRRPIVPAGGAFGLLLAAVIFLLFGARASSVSRLDDLDARLTKDRLEESRAPSSSAVLSRLIAKPVFALTTGPGALPDVAVTLTGVAIGPQKTAALISVGGGPVQWLALGATRDGVTLTQVQASKVVVDTPIGFKEVRLWDQVSTGAQMQVSGVRPEPGPAQPPPPPPPFIHPLISR